MRGYKYFESQGNDEEVILVIKRYILGIFQEMAFTVIAYSVIFLAFTLVPIYFPVITQGFGYNIFVLLWSLLMLFVTLFIFTAWSLHYLNVAIITNEHLVEIDQKGVFVRNVSVMTLDKLQDISASQEGFFPNMFNYGKINIQTAGELPNFVLEYVRNPHEVARKVIEVTEAYCEISGIKETKRMTNSEISGTNDIDSLKRGE